MTGDALLSDDLPTLLSAFPNDALRGLVGIIKQHKSWTPFPANRAYDAHGLAEDADFKVHAKAIADEIMWWGSNDIHRQFGEVRGWREMVGRTAKEIGVPAAEREETRPSWRIECSIIAKMLQDWGKLTPVQRDAALGKAGIDLDGARGGLMAVAGGLARLGGQELLAFLAARGAGYALAATVFAPVATVLGTIWAAYDLAGPGYRVLRPVVLTVAYTRQRLRDERMASAFED